MGVNQPLPFCLQPQQGGSGAIRGLVWVLEARSASTAPSMRRQQGLPKVFRLDSGRTGLLRLWAVGLWIVSVLESSWAGSLPRPEREWLVRLQQAQQKIAEGRVAEAAALLEQILTSGEWGYVPIDAEQNLHLPLEQAAGRLVESLPPEGLGIWEAWCAARAVRRLDEALLQRDREALRRVVQQYPGTRFAAEAALVMAADAFDRRQWTETIRWTEKVFRFSASSSPGIKQQALLLAGAAYLWEGQEEQARQCFAQLLAVGAVKGLRIGQQVLPQEASIDRLLEVVRSSVGLPQQPAGKEPSGGLVRGWPMFRGDPARNASANWTGQIGQLRWRLDMEAVEEFSGPAFQGAGGPRFSVPGQMPAAHPVLGEDVALVRLPTRLVAVDLWTGRQKWEYPPGGDPLLQLSQGQRVMPTGVVLRMHTPSALLSRQRIFEDTPYGQMVVHGSRVFLLDDLGMQGSTVFSVFPFPAAVPPGTVPTSSPPNRLIALDLRQEGKMLWSVGGKSGEDEPALAGAFFLGPPLPVEGVLYVLADQAEQIRLLALAETTGQLLWSLPIAVPERTILLDPLRRLAGSMPSYADGVLICPTSAGAVVAVDPWTQTVLWAYETPLTDSFWSSRRLMVLRAIGAMQSPQYESDHFSLDSTATIADQHVLLAPVESDQLFCFELHTGRLRWQRQIEEFRFVAAVAEGVVLTVGSRSVGGWQLRTGKPAWEEMNIPLPEGFNTAGRGFRMARTYYLPIAKGEGALQSSVLLRIDIPTGRLEEQLPLPTKTRIGNVAAAGQTLVFFSPEGVEAFDSKKP